ncbi:hypothetical protein IGJ55_002990 [Enterococcus sp. AZ170]|uniref:hypothetical protein n=1 Tax=Enterococcus sp. AZ170 TaxID=2774747 RepID=UPI003D3016B0
MSENFEFWDEKLEKEYNRASLVIDEAFNSTTSFSDIGLIVLGNQFSGKSEFIAHVIETQIFIDKKRMKTIGEIIKISYEGFLKVEVLKNDEKSRIQKVSEFIEPSISIPLGLTGISIDIGLEKIVSKIIGSNKKINIIWIENINNHSPISLEQISKIVKENENQNNIYLISSRVLDIYNRVLHLIPNLRKITIPNISIEWFEKTVSNPINNQAFPNNLYRKLKEVNNVRELIQMSEGSYGFLKLLTENQYSFRASKLEKQNIIPLLFFNQLDDDDIQDEMKLKLLLQSFLYSDDGLYITWLETLFPDFSFDYFQYIENWEDRGLINKLENQKNYQINPIFLKYREEYFENFENKSLSRNLSKKIDFFLKQDSPEKYNLRCINANNFDKDLSAEYIFIYSLREPIIQEIDLVKDNILTNYNLNLLNLLKTPTKNLNDEKRDELLTQLSNSKTDYLPLLVYAEYAYFRLQILLGYSYGERNRVRNKTELQIHRLIRTFDDLIEQEEDDMAIKIGLILSSQIINYLSKQEHAEAKRIYKCVTEKIYKRKKINYPYYKRYDIIGKFISTSIINYKQASYNLRSVLESLNTKNYNYKELMPIVFCNLLGITLFLDYQSIEELLKFYVAHQELLSYSKTKDYKILNNIVLAKACLNDEKMSQKNNDYLLEFKKIKDKDVSAINYAGLLFYSEQYGKARSVLKNIMDREKYDDFYQFYCKYNLCLIDLIVDLNKNRLSILNNLEYLETPSLFYGKPLESILQKRVGVLKKIVKQIDTNLKTPKDLDIIFLKYTTNKIPLFKFCWNFSDYQHWS